MKDLFAVEFQKTTGSPVFKKKVSIVNIRCALDQAVIVTGVQKWQDIS